MIANTRRLIIIFTLLGVAVLSRTGAVKATTICEYVYADGTVPADSRINEMSLFVDPVPNHTVASFVTYSETVKVVATNNDRTQYMFIALSNISGAGGYGTISTQGYYFGEHRLIVTVAGESAPGSIGTIHYTIYRYTDCDVLDPSGN